MNIFIVSIASLLLIFLLNKRFSFLGTVSCNVNYHENDNFHGYRRGHEWNRRFAALGRALAWYRREAEGGACAVVAQQIFGGSSPQKYLASSFFFFIFEFLVFFLPLHLVILSFLKVFCFVVCFNIQYLFRLWFFILKDGRRESSTAHKKGRTTT